MKFLISADDKIRPGNRVTAGQPDSYEEALNEWLLGPIMKYSNWLTLFITYPFNKLFIGKEPTKAKKKKNMP